MAAPWLHPEPFGTGPKQPDFGQGLMLNAQHMLPFPRESQNSRRFVFVVFKAPGCGHAGQQCLLHSMGSGCSSTPGFGVGHRAVPALLLPGGTATTCCTAEPSADPSLPRGGRALCCINSY